jgi:hypothetical protein
MAGLQACDVERLQTCHGALPRQATAAMRARS